MLIRDPLEHFPKDAGNSLKKCGKLKNVANKKPTFEKNRLLSNSTVML